MKASRKELTCNIGVEGDPQLIVLPLIKYPCNLGTRLNEPHYFKQPLPHLRDHMTVMCVLSKISGLKDKIRISETRNAILKGKSVSAEGKYGGNKKLLRDHEEIVERLRNRCENRREDLLTIKIGVKKRPEVETGNIWGEDERLSRIIRPNKVSVASSRPRFLVDDAEVLEKTCGGEGCRYLGSSSPPRLPEPVTLKLKPSRRCTHQHWESMINAGPRGLLPLEEESRSIDSSEEIARCDEPVFKRRGSTARRDRTGLEDGCLFQGDKNDSGAVAKTEYKESQPASKSRSNFANRRKVRRLARSWLPSSEADNEWEPAVPATSIFKRMALGLFEIFGTNGKLREANAPPRVKVLYRRTPNCEERRVRNDRTRGKETREEICGDYEEKKR